MSLPNGADISIGGVPFWVDEDYENKLGRRGYIHGGRSIFAGRTDITGKPGAQNLKEDYLVWALTRWDGEGQVVLDPSDNESPFLFYRSEGLNARVPGQLSLNKSLLSETVSTTSSTTTWQGAADFADITGASTTSATDRALTSVGDQIAASSSVTPGAANVQMDFYLYVAPFSDTATTIQGSTLNKVDGSPQTSGTDKVLTRGDTVWTSQISSGSELNAGETTRVELYASVTNILRGAMVRFQIIDVTGHQENVVAGGLYDLDTASGTPFQALTFIPKTNHDYRVKVAIPGGTEPTPVETTVDKILYGPEVTNDSATIEVYNQTGGATLSSAVVDITLQGAGGSEPGSVTASISFASVAATAYRARVSRTSGKQKIWTDKVIAKVLTGATWVIDDIELGLGAQTSGVFTPKVWAVAHDAAASADNIAFAYNPSTDVWDSVATLDTATGAGLTCYAMAHSDAAEYALLSSNEVVSWTAAGTDTLRATNIPAAAGMTVAQDRLWVMSEGSAGTTIYSSPLETVNGNITTDTATRSVVINSKTKTPDTSLRQRMCGSPTGARFFINYGDITCKVYEVDGSGASLEPRELADLGAGIKGTCIAYVGGLTFIGAQFYGDSTASDTDKKPRSVLYAIDQNGVLQLVEFFREDSPDVRPPEFLFPYQTDLYVLQGDYVWRHDLRGGGLYLEYELTPATPANQRALAVLFGRIFAAYTSEIFVAGSLGTYRRSSASGGNTLESSIFDFGLPSVSKALAKIEVMCDTLDSGTQVAVEYQTDQSGTWVLAGQMTAGKIQTFYVEGVSFSTLQIRLRLSTSDGVHTPILKGVMVWASSATDEEYFDLSLRTDDQDSFNHIGNEQELGSVKSGALMTLWRNKEVTTLIDGYAEEESAGQSYLGTIEDLRIEQTMEGEGRAVLTFRVVR